MPSISPGYEFCGHPLFLFNFLNRLFKPTGHKPAAQWF
jgi:hypothetical protein